MNIFQKLERWGDTHHPRWLDFIRIALGIFLFLKGVEFMNNMERLSEMITNSEFLGSISLGILAHYVVFAHLVGGLLIAFGLLTRFACLIQIPILLGAIFFNSANGIFQPHAEMWLAVLVLFLLCFFLLEGSGPLSADAWMKKHPEKKGGILNT